MPESWRWVFPSRPLNPAEPMMGDVGRRLDLASQQSQTGQRRSHTGSSITRRSTIETTAPSCRACQPPTEKQRRYWVALPPRYEIPSSYGGGNLPEAWIRPIRGDQRKRLMATAFPLAERRFRVKRPLFRASRGP